MAVMWENWTVEHSAYKKDGHSEAQRADSKVHLTAAMKVAMKEERMVAPMDSLKAFATVALRDEVKVVSMAVSMVNWKVEKKVLLLVDWMDQMMVVKRVEKMVAL